jgi:hypothetical protein
MPDTINDPSSNTQAFQVWVEKQAAQPEPAPSKAPLVIGAVVLVLLILGVLGWLALS